MKGVCAEKAESLEGNHLSDRHHQKKKKEKKKKSADPDAVRSSVNVRAGNTGNSDTVNRKHLISNDFI